MSHPDQQPIPAGGFDRVTSERLMAELARLQHQVDSQGPATTPSQGVTPELLASLASAFTAAAPPRSPGYSGDNSLKLKEPEVFNGGRKDLERFLAALLLKFSAERKRFPDDHSKITYAMSLLRGDAFEIVQNQIVQDVDNLGSFQDFRSSLERAFGDPDSAQTAMLELENLRQRGSIVKYNAEFHRLENILHLNDIAKLAFYRRGVSDHIKNILSEKLEKYDTFEAFEKAVTQLDANLYVRKQDQRYSVRGTAPRHHHGRGDNTGPRGPAVITEQTHTPMEIDAVISTPARRGPLSDKEKKYRRDNDLCSYCGGSGHYANSCPEKKKKFTAAKN
ncbi:protein of unknown function [Taphrina deformans PYCC 5710]|uniref:CCHC-type domain-containing protein n=1 Tax=Taphrina deformans (strain PYCC 5710 / ATCC 11124 / CBS 356.35 / IMI 108563 / JCM 9778 / NBRC 8474) TaxID=1097556 RepID=R4XH61_TAPDE|nr:protein of unknown function [Taphrina deformans PYCC 5710]|eukprot:CCG85028.1 protein of unknown function [Taphrina deformans PYCC 5710]